MKKALILLLALALIGGGTVYYLWNKPHKDMKAARSTLSVSARELFDKYNADETAANAEYLDKVITVTGTVRSVSTDPLKITLESDDEAFGVLCELDPLASHPRTDFAVGERVAMKGLCAGFNFDVQLARCVEQR